jgi:hypothetical protein
MDRWPLGRPGIRPSIFQQSANLLPEAYFRDEKAFPLPRKML